MFTKFYLSILLAVMAATTGCYGYFSYTYAQRLQSYQNDVLTGSLAIIQDSVGTLSTQARENYLEIAYRLLGASRLEERDLAGEIPTFRLHPSVRDGPMMLVGESDNIVFAFRGQDGITEYISFPGISEQQFRAHALLVLSKLRSMNNGPDINALRRYSPYFLKLDSLVDTSLDPQQRQDLQSKRVVVSHNTDENQFYIYAPYDQERVFIVGPISTFEVLPAQDAVLMVLVIAVVFVCVAYWIIFVLASRIKPINSMVEAFGEGELNARVNVSGNDHFAKLSERINAMATRINGLLDTQRGIMQAVSHELRTPLARMRFKLAFIDDEFEGQATQQTDPIRRDIVQVEQLIDEILAYHKLTQTPVLVSEPIDLNDVLINIRSNLSPIYPKVDFEFNAISDGVVIGDAVSVERMLQNLCSNALKHAKNAIRVQLTNSPKGCRIHVEDDGPGVDEKDKLHIFDAFYRADSQINQQQKGYGLGLSIVNRIITLHEGKITLSDSELGGARFSVELPDLQHKLV